MFFNPFDHSYITLVSVKNNFKMWDQSNGSANIVEM